MSKTIRVKDEVKQELIKLMQPQESFSQVIERLLWVKERADDAVTNLQAATAQQKRR